MPSSERRFRRHDLVWLDAMRWRGALRSPLGAAALAALDTWFSNGRPAVVRRQDTGTADGLSLGVALPPSADGVRKLPLHVDFAMVQRAAPPLPLVAVIPSAPSSWRRELARLAAGANAIGVELRVYGSLVWQHVSGETYVTRTSDVDLLWSTTDPTTLERMLAHLAQWERISGLAADGELLLPDDGAIAWKELTRRPRQLLVKRTDSIELREYDDALSLITPAACRAT